MPHLLGEKKKLRLVSIIQKKVDERENTRHLHRRKEEHKPRVNSMMGKEDLKGGKHEQSITTRSGGEKIRSKSRELIFNRFWARRKAAAGKHDELGFDRFYRNDDASNV